MVFAVAAAVAGGASMAADGATDAAAGSGIGDLKLPENDYPTTARADYVFACMETNGRTPEMLQKCSCSIDQIAALLPWAEYEEAETIMSVVSRGGDATSLFRSPQLQLKVHALKLAQVEAELKCF